MMIFVEVVNRSAYSLCLPGLVTLVMMMMLLMMLLLCYDEGC
jgi:hypothetical protein